MILCTYADTLRVPASDNLSLMRAKASGGDVRMIYSPQDALKIARDNPQREVVFFAIGFETTTPPTALIIKQAEDEGITNFSVLCNHVLTPAAITPYLAIAGSAPVRHRAAGRLHRPGARERGDRQPTVRALRRMNTASRW